MGLRAFFRKLGRSNRLFPRKLSLTREGKYFLLITFGVGFAAINSGNNLLYLTLGLLLSMIVVSPRSLPSCAQARRSWMAKVRLLGLSR